MCARDTRRKREPAARGASLRLDTRNWWRARGWFSTLRKKSPLRAGGERAGVIPWSGTQKLLFCESPSMSHARDILFWKNSNATTLLGARSGNRGVRADWVGSTSRPVQGSEDGSG